MSEHLTEASYAAFMEDRLPEDERARVTAHLQEECETCDAFLAERGAVDRMDGVIDRALVSISPPSAAADDLGFRRVEHAFRGSRMRLGIASGLVAAAIAAIFFVPEDEQRFKGEGVVAPRLELLMSRDGEVAPIGRDAKIRVGDTLLFRVHLEQQGCVVLFRDDAPLVEAPICFDAGEHVLEANGAPLGWLAKVPGKADFSIAPAGAAPAGVAPFSIIVEDR